LDVTLSFESGTELDLRANSTAFRMLAVELDEQGLASLAESIKANARVLKIADADKVAAGRAIGAMIAHL
jgi:hypothetical protein